jgi:hypothetical protein
LEVGKFWNELLQSLTSEEGLKIRKTEIDALLKTDTVDFYQHLQYFKSTLDKKVKQTQKNAKVGR